MHPAVGSTNPHTHCARPERSRNPNLGAVISARAKPAAEEIGWDCIDPSLQRNQFEGSRMGQHPPYLWPIRAEVAWLRGSGVLALSLHHDPSQIECLALS